MPRIAFAELAQETDSFSPLRAGLADFEGYGLFRGREMLERIRGAGPLGGLIEVAEQQSRAVEWLPLLRAWGGAGGTITDATLRQLLDELLVGLRAAGAVDAVFLALHGAAAAESEDDIEGAVLEAVRHVVGPRTPVVVPLDHHANVTRRMMRHADLLVGHETQPHDPIDTGRKAARLMFRMLDGAIRPVRAWQKIPLVTPQDQFLTSSGPMHTWFDRARQLERLAGVLDVSPYPMQPWLDAAEGGWAVVAHTDDDHELARRVVEEMAALAWALRREFFRSERLPPTEAVRQATSGSQGLVILSDTGDSVYGGAPGDNTTLLRELIAQGVPDSDLALIPVVDEQAVEAAHQAGVAATITLDVGGRYDCLFSQPVRVTGRIVALSRGLSIDIPERGVCHVGRTALLACGGVRIALMNDRSFAVNHPVLYQNLGIDVSEAKLVVLKTASNFQFFAKWRCRLIRVDTPGTTQSNLNAFTWRHIPRPCFPFEPCDAWRPAPELFF